MAKRRKPATWDIQREIRQTQSRSSLPYVLAQRNSQIASETDVAALEEADVFSQSQSQGDFIPLTYYPTKTSWPANGYHHRRTISAGYDRDRGILRVEFYTDGAIYDYGTMSPVPPYVAYQFRQTQSPGRFINSTLETYGYERIN